MPNAVLERLEQDLRGQFEFIDQTLQRVQDEGRELVDAERANLENAKKRVGELEAQIKPLREFEELRSAHQATLSRVAAPRRDDDDDETDTRGARSLGDRQPAAGDYRSAGHFIVDILKARGFYPDYRGGNQSRRAAPFMPADRDAAARLERAVVNQTTADTAGLLPENIVGQVVSLIDSRRPFITSLGGAKPMGGIPGKTFSRPKVTQHAQSGVQGAEKGQLPSQKMTITGIDFTKETHGGTVDVSRQDIDWSSPSAWNILVNDLAAVYAVDTENAAADAFAASVVTNTSAAASADLAGWAAALYDAAGKVYSGGSMLPDRIWCSVDMWAKLGPIVDVARLVFAQNAGNSALGSFAGNIIDLPRIVVPAFPASTVIVGVSSLVEVYEEVIGLLSVVEPSILGVEVAYGGYVAFGTLEEKAFGKVTPFVGP